MKNYSYLKMLNMLKKMISFLNMEYMVDYLLRNIDNLKSFSVVSILTLTT
jgi:hypothetical protein